MTTLRADAARSRERILAAARAQCSGELRLNDLAKDAGVGVGTVYRHFPTVHAIVEALALDTLEELDARMRSAAAAADPAAALRSTLDTALELQLREGGLQSVLLADESESDAVRALKRSVYGVFLGVLDRARSAGAVRADITVEQLQHLVCGVEHAVRLGSPEERPLFLAVLVAGLRPAA